MRHDFYFTATKKQKKEAQSCPECISAALWLKKIRIEERRVILDDNLVLAGSKLENAEDLRSAAQVPGEIHIASSVRR